MIAFVNGIVEDYSEEAVILDVNGIETLFNFAFIN